MKLVIRRETISASEVRVIMNLEMSDDEVLQFRGKYVYISYFAREFAATLPQGLHIDCSRDEVEEIENRIIEEVKEAYLELKLAIFEDSQYLRSIPL